MFHLEVRLPELLIERLHAGAVMPNKLCLERQRLHALPGVVKLLLVRTVEGQDQLLEVFHLHQFVDDPGHGGRLEFRKKRRQQQDDFAAAGDHLDFRLQVFDRSIFQPLQDGDCALLPEISHGPLLMGIKAGPRASSSMRPAL